MAILGKLFDANRREVKSLSKLADKVLAKEEEYASFSDEQLQNKAEEFKILYPEIKNEIVNVVVKDPKYGNMKNFAETVKWGAFSDFAINRDLKFIKLKS